MRDLLSIGRKFLRLKFKEDDDVPDNKQQSTKNEVRTKTEKKSNRVEKTRNNLSFSGTRDLRRINSFKSFAKKSKHLPNDKIKVMSTEEVTTLFNTNFKNPDGILHDSAKNPMQDDSIIFEASGISSCCTQVSYDSSPCATLENRNNSTHQHSNNDFTKSNNVVNDMSTHSYDDNNSQSSNKKRSAPIHNESVESSGTSSSANSSDLDCYMSEDGSCSSSEKIHPGIESSPLQTVLENEMNQSSQVSDKGASVRMIVDDIGAIVQKHSLTFTSHASEEHVIQLPDDLMYAFAKRFFASFTSTSEVGKSKISFAYYFSTVTEPSSVPFFDSSSGEIEVSSNIAVAYDAAFKEKQGNNTKHEVNQDGCIGWVIGIKESVVGGRYSVMGINDKIVSCEPDNDNSCQMLLMIDTSINPVLPLVCFDPVMREAFEHKNLFSGLLNDITDYIHFTANISKPSLDCNVNDPILISTGTVRSTTRKKLKQTPDEMNDLYSSSIELNNSWFDFEGSEFKNTTGGSKLQFDDTPYFNRKPK